MQSAEYDHYADVGKLAAFFLKNYHRSADGLVFRSTFCYEKGERLRTTLREGVFCESVQAVPSQGKYRISKKALGVRP